VYAYNQMHRETDVCIYSYLNAYMAVRMRAHEGVLSMEMDI